MQAIDIVVSSTIEPSARARQVSSMFDVPFQTTQTSSWKGSVPIDSRPWNVGLIVGPSGCGKSSILRNMFGQEPIFPWSDRALVDDFDKAASVEQISAALSSVGLNTIPAWLRPFGVLSNGERFRADLARRLLETDGVIVCDEFTSVVDRQVAKVGSYAVSKTVRKNARQFVAASCHYDIVEWLQPDWILEPSTMTFQWREVQKRPAIEVEIRRVGYDIWPLFAPFHYLTAELLRAARCFALFVDGRPAAFAGLLYKPISNRSKNITDIWGVSRLVTLPDWQGLGLAFVLADAIGSALKDTRRRLRTYPAHPSLIRAFDRSPLWSMETAPTKVNPRSSLGFGGRPCAVFEYRGKSFGDVDRSRAFLGF
jgi:ABC-type ATPase involved in cell division/GNAT superfamily N-acetyltransferase